jgi:hypothetical protein
VGNEKFSWIGLLAVNTFQNKRLMNLRIAIKTTKNVKQTKSN